VSRAASLRAERELILLSAGTATRREVALGHAERLMDEVDWTHLAATLSWRRLLPTLGPRIETLSHSAPPEDFRAATRKALETNRRHATFLQLVSMRAINALADAGIGCVSLKGPTFAEAVYGDLGRRQSSDVDLLVAPDSLAAAVTVIRGLGYAPPSDYVDRSGLPKLHFLLVHEKQKLPPIELHWRVHYYERRFAWERLLTPAGQRHPGDPSPEQLPGSQSLGGRRLEPIDELIALLLFYARDGFIDLRLATDVSAWWDVFGSELPAGALHARLAEYPELGRVVSAAIKVAEKIVGLPARALLGNAHAFSVRSRIAVRLANPNPRRISQAQMYADIGLLDGLLCPPGGFGAFVRRQLLLPRELLEELDRRSPKRRARSALGRAVVMVGRFGLTGVRLAFAPRERLPRPVRR
jgi:hypothetical protein